MNSPFPAPLSRLSANYLLILGLLLTSANAIAQSATSTCLMLLGKKFKTPQPQGAQFSVECYFLRALRFRSDDTTARMMYASYLSNQARAAEASKELAQVGKVAGDNAFTFYNMGQIYFDLKDYDKALENAHKAYGLGLTLSGLRERLTRAGHWRDADLAASFPSSGYGTGVQTQ